MRIKGVPHANTRTFRANPETRGFPSSAPCTPAWPGCLRYIQARSDETLLEDSQLFADRARQAAADARVDLVPGQQHTFQMAVGRPKDADEAMRG
jgi:acetyl esterase/lipase